MTSFIDYATAREVAEEVYLKSMLRFPSGWEFDTTFNPGGIANGTGNPGELKLTNGFYAYALKPVGDDTGKRILAFRGTEGNATDIFADVTNLGKSQFNDAALVVNQWLADNLIANKNIELVGHSLGGALVQWAINNTNLTASDPEHPNSVINLAHLTNPAYQFNPAQLHFYTFNAPGISNVSSTAADKTSILMNGEHHVIEGFAPFINGDPVHLLGGKPIGANGTVIAHVFNFKANHEVA